MPKLSEPSDLAGYARVATRVSAFYERYPDGRIITQLWERTREQVVFRALVYRYQGDSKPAATGWAAEREGDGDINMVACLENTETSAIGRALANLGFTASLERPSAEEMMKASRARVRLARTVMPTPAARKLEPTRLATVSEALHVGDELDEVFRLIQRALAYGLRLERARRWRIALLSARPSADAVREYEHRLRRWIARHGTPRPA